MVTVVVVVVVVDEVDVVVDPGEPPIGVVAK